MNCEISLESEPTESDVAIVRDGIHTYNRRFATNDYERLTLFLRDADGSIAGGLLGETYWGWLHVSFLWVQEDVRGQGYGSSLLGQAESEAIRRGCNAAFLDTLSFQARPFYERQGYSVFGVLPDHPAGHTRYILTKQLKLVTQS